VHRRYAVHLAATGRFPAAIDCVRRACKLDPLSAACEQTRGVVHYWARDFEGSLACAQRALAIAPNFGLAHHLVGGLLLHHHQYAGAIDALERATSLSGASTFDLGYQAWGLGYAGDRIKACRILENLVAAAQREYVAPLSIAHCHLGLGDVDEALTWVERAYVPGMSQWPYYLAAPLYEPLFRYKRFQSVLERIGLPRPLV
jgi:tetratricopeptide (TPR) repeat protein